MPGTAVFPVICLPEASQGTPEGSLPVPMQPQGDRTALPDGGVARQAPVPSAANPSAGGTSQSPQVGEVRKGYRFKGGNPADPNSWEKQ